MTLLAAVLIYGSFDLGQVTAIFVLTIALCGIMDILTQGVHRRVDALIEQLRQEGMLESGLPNSGREYGPKKTG